MTDLFGGVCEARGTTPCAHDHHVVCRCSREMGHLDSHRCLRCEEEFNAAPDPPTGPAAEVPDHAAGRWAKYLEWRSTEEAELVYRACVADAIAAHTRGERRWSIRTYWGQLRAEHHIKLNDAHYSWMADELVAEHPELEEVIERRARKKAQLS